METVNTPHDVVEISTEDTIMKLYEAALRGCKATLYSLVKNDPSIINKVSLTSFSETPLHRSALHGHLDFTNALLSQKPKLTIELDSLKRSPLHLASAEGHIEIVIALLHANKDVCLVPDQDGRIPLHLAVMRGRIEVIQKLISERPESIRVHLDGDTILHLCIRYNHLDALRILMTFVDDDEFLDLRNQEGNTIFHSAVMLKQLETIKFLYSLPGAKTRANALSGIGFTTLDVLEHTPRDFKSLEIRDILIEAGVRRAKDINTLTPSSPPTVIPSSPSTVIEIDATSSSPATVVETEEQPNKSWCSKLMNYLKYHSDWMEERQGTLMLVATVIATMTFQAAINPPGGVWQQDTKEGSSHCTTQNLTLCEAGIAVLAYTQTDYYLAFVTWDAVSFIASLSVVLLVISGFPAKNKVCMWILTIAMVISLTFMALTFAQGMALVFPDYFLDQVSVVYTTSLFIWIGLLAVIGLICTIRFVYWLVKKLLKSPSAV